MAQRCLYGVDKNPFAVNLANEEETSNGRQRKKLWHYRWTEEVHDEVLARLLDLNQKRAQAEILGGKVTQKKPKAKASKPPKIKEDAPIIPGLESL